MKTPVCLPRLKRCSTSTRLKRLSLNRIFCNFSVSFPRPDLPALNDLRKRYRQWRELRAWERRVLVLCGLALPAIWVAVRLLPFNRVHRYFANVAAPSPVGTLPEGLTAVEYAQRC